MLEVRARLPCLVLPPVLLLQEMRPHKGADTATGDTTALVRSSHSGNWWALELGAVPRARYCMKVYRTGTGARGHLLLRTHTLLVSHMETGTQGTTESSEVSQLFPDSPSSASRLSWLGPLTLPLPVL